MRARSPVAFSLLTLAIVAWILPASAFADRIGQPYRGPIELLGLGGGDTGTGDPGSDPGLGDGGDGGGDGGDGGGGDGGGGDGGGGDTGSEPGAGAGGGTGPGGKSAKLDGKILWQFWWEYNKDRFLARATKRGRVNAGSAYYWFGSGAKYPPRETVPVSEAQRKAKVFRTLIRALEDSDARVRAETAIALGRLGVVLASEKEKKKDAPDNLVVRVLIGLLESKQAGDVHNSAVLGLGICGDEDGANYLMRNLENLHSHARPYAYIALGLARHLPAIGLLFDDIPKSSRHSASDLSLAALHGIGLMGPMAVPELNRNGHEGIKAIEKLVSGRGNDAVVMQAVTALARMQVSVKKLTRLAAGKTGKNIKWTTILSFANYSGDEASAEAAFKALKSKGCFGGAGQEKNFAVLAMGDLASRLDPNSKVRTAILKFVIDSALEKKNNYARSCACIAMGMANEKGAVDQLVALLSDKTGDDYVAASAAMGLGLLRAAEKADPVREHLMLKRNWDDDARGYGALGLALMGDTTRMSNLIEFRHKSLTPKTERQVPLALGVLGDKRQVSSLIKFFAKKWKTRDRFRASNAVFGLAWVKDQSAVDQLVSMVTGGADPEVRGMAAVALGYVAARDTVSPLTRCFENISFRNHFGNWDLLYQISRIL